MAKPTTRIKEPANKHWRLSIKLPLNYLCCKEFYIANAALRQCQWPSESRFALLTYRREIILPLVEIDYQPPFRHPGKTLSASSPPHSYVFKAKAKAISIIQLLRHFRCLWNQVGAYAFQVFILHCVNVPMAGIIKINVEDVKKKKVSDIFVKNYRNYRIELPGF
ncbi:hypothetical protein ACTXT7_003833 [Hymenolepis weldensis]